jgi:glycerophosphoryl diester phosphodiesterase
VIGHRGAAGLLPENTLAAFRKALEIRVDAVELDVQLSSDGELVIYHNYWLDPNITRTPDGSWVQGKVPIKTASLAQLQTYDVGRTNPLSINALRHPAQRPVDGERIPSLREAISLFNNSRGEHKPQLWIEIKTSPETTDHSSSPQAVGSALVRMLQQESISARVHILSFDWRALYHVQKIAPDIPTIYLSRIGGSVRNIQPGRPGPSPWTTPIDVSDFDGSLPRAIRAAGGRYWAPHHREVSESSLQEAHRLGLKVSVWTPDEAAQMRRMIEMGVDGIITNRPDILQSVSADR